MKDKSNPFNSPLVGIFLQNIDATTSLDILSRNDECEYHRLELTESIFDSFPSGILIVRDKADFISQLDKYLIIYIKFVYENGGSDTFRIHSVAHLNNAASATEETYIAVNFSNAFYFFCQENTLSTILNIKKSKVYRIDKFFEEVGKKAGSSNIRSVVINNRTDNYICYRPLNPKLDGTEVTSDNIPEYLNYLTTYSVPLKSALPAPTGKTTSRYTDKPRYVFWSSWGNDLNLKFISSVTDDIIGQTALKDYNLKYAIYSGDQSTQSMNGNVYKKIYNYSTNQGLQFITKQYYYVRKTPKILDIPGVSGGNTYSELAYQFLDDGSKYNIEIVGNTAGINAFAKGSEELQYSGSWGYPNDNTIPNSSAVSTHMSHQYGLGKSYNKFNLAGITGAYEFIDNSEMWKNVFDLTPLDPYYPNSIPSEVGTDASGSNLQKVLDIKHNSLVKLAGSTANNQLELIRKIELQNFVMYSLCCMGEDSDDSFFAVLTSYNQNTVIDSQASNIKWVYGWNKINFSPVTPSSNPNQIYSDKDVMELSHWVLDPNVKSAATPNATGVNTFAINLNESNNTVGGQTPTYAPGWNSPPSGFSYRPIGLKSTQVVNATGTINHVVKMYKKSWKNIFNTSGVTLSNWNSLYDNKYLYYFTAENVLDGTCP
jgi:hypothetical protein